MFGVDKSTIGPVDDTPLMHAFTSTLVLSSVVSPSRWGLNKSIFNHSVISWSRLSMRKHQLNGVCLARRRPSLTVFGAKALGFERNRNGI